MEKTQRTKTESHDRSTEYRNANRTDTNARTCVRARKYFVIFTTFESIKNRNITREGYEKVTRKDESYVSNTSEYSE